MWPVSARCRVADAAPRAETRPTPAESPRRSAFARLEAMPQACEEVEWLGRRRYGLRRIDPNAGQIEPDPDVGLERGEWRDDRAAIGETRRASLRHVPPTPRVGKDDPCQVAMRATI